MKTFKPYRFILFENILNYIFRNKNQSLNQIIKDSQKIKEDAFNKLKIYIDFKSIYD